jgi:hypothetical protein
MDYVARAKSLLQKAALHGALSILPLALAVPGQAANILPFGSKNCLALNFQAALLSCASDSAPLAEQNGIQGLKLFTVAPGIAMTSNGATTSSAVSWASLVVSGAYLGDTLLAGTTIPTSADFNLSVSGGTIHSWQLSLVMGEFASFSGSRLAGDYFFQQFSGSGAGSFHVENHSASLLRNITAGTFITTYALFRVDWSPNANTTATLRIDVPSNSIDFNAIQSASPVPEPGAFALLGLVLGSGWLVRQRK